MARKNHLQEKKDTKNPGKPFLKLGLGVASTIILFAVVAAGAQNLLKGNVLKQIDAKPNTDLVDRYGEAANDPVVADALRKAKGTKLNSDEVKAKTEANEALQSGVWKPGTDPTMALMYGFVPPNMSPEQAAIMAQHLPKMPRMPHSMTPEDIARMAGEPNPDLQMGGMPEPMSPYIPIPDSLAAASRQPNTRQLSLIPQFPMSPGQLVGGPGMAPMMMGAPVMPYGANKRAIEEANQRQIENYLRDRLGPGYVSPFRKNHNPRPQQAVKTEDGKHVAESDHQSVVGVCDDNGNEITGIAYDPYGQPTVLHGGTVMPTFMYKGMLWHDRSQNYLTLHRVYNPKLGRFLSRDPLGATNSYAYCGNDPINYIDPLGLWRLSIQWRSPFGVDPALGAHGNLMLEPTGNETFPVQGWGASRNGLDMAIVPKGILENPKYRQSFLDSDHSKMSYCEIKAKMDAAAGDVGAMDWSFYRPFDVGPIPAQNSDTALWEMINRMGITPPTPMAGTWTPGYGPKPETPELEIPVPRFQMPDFSIPMQYY